jgi:hypothetical protein
MQIKDRGLRLGTVVAAVLSLFAADRGFAAEDSPSDAEIRTWTDERAAGWQPTAAERRFDEIGWVESLTAARKLSVESGRPVFLFTLDGRIAIGRC